MSLTELQVSTIEFKYIIMLGQEPRVIIVSLPAEKKTGTGKEVPRDYWPGNHMQDQQRTETEELKGLLRYLKLLKMKADKFLKGK